MTKDEKIRSILQRGVEEIIHKKHLETQLRGRKKLRVKLGFDPTSPFLHIGNAVTLLKLRAFQDLGHTAVIIVGDFTGLIGDTSDKESERPMLTEAQVKENIKTYFEQAFKILDPSKTEAVYNSTWLKKLDFQEIGRMADLFSVNEFTSRELMKKRLSAGKRVGLRELLYPLMQGYDSVAVKADVEIGGTDQRFNMLAGRTLQECYGQQPQDIIMLSLLEGNDGRKMSKSYGNVINILDDANTMFGKVMTVNDNLIDRYFTMATNTLWQHIEEIKKSYDNPRDQKLILAHAIVEQYHGAHAARQAQENFISQFSKKELPSEMEAVKVKPGQYLIADLLIKLKMVTSKSEARRLVEQGGVKINQKALAASSLNEKIKIGTKNNLIIQVGKRKFVKIK